MIGTSNTPVAVLLHFLSCSNAERNILPQACLQRRLGAQPDLRFDVLVRKQDASKNIALPYILIVYHN